MKFFPKFRKKFGIDYNISYIKGCNNLTATFDSKLSDKVIAIICLPYQCTLLLALELFTEPDSA